MSEAARNVEHEYWRPAVQPAREAAQPAAVAATEQACQSCGADYVMGARYCHVCGSERDVLEGTDRGFSRWLDFHQIRSAMGLSMGSLIAFVVGIACVLAAIFTGLVYTAATVLDWQAVQLWRIEWLLAAVAAFAAGILLKSRET